MTDEPQQPLDGGPQARATPSPQSSPPSDTAGSDAADPWARPVGVASSFGDHPELPPSPPARHVAPPGAEEAFGPPLGSGDAFAPLPGERLLPRHGAPAEPVHPMLRAAFDRAPGAEGPFDAPAGSRLDPAQADAAPRWWKDDAATDPWRDPQSPFWLGRAALFLQDRPLAMGDGEELPEDVEDDEPAEPAPVAGTRVGLSLLLTIVLVALLAGGLGGGAGYWLTKSGNGALHDPDVSLAQGSTPANRPPGSVADIAKRVTPSVVEVQVQGTSASDIGSGVVIDKGGYILTNNHVITAAATGGSIRVVFSDNTIAVARIVGRDPVTDLAVLKVSGAKLTVASLGDSSTLAVGDPVIAIGSPLGLSGTVTTGIVSAVNRAVAVAGEGNDPEIVFSAIQTDASINPGNSGGALVAADGTVIGINSSIDTLGSTSGGQSGSIGLGFAIPINSARDIAAQLIKTGKAVHATLGVKTRSVTDGNREGAYILQVDPGSPAAKAGLKEGDVIKLVDGSLIITSEDLTVAISNHKPGQTVTVRYIRGSTESDVAVTLGTDS